MAECNTTNVQKSCVDIASDNGERDQRVFSFSIKNFSHLKNKSSGYYIDSENFSLENNYEYSWHLRLSTGDVFGADTDYLILSVVRSDFIGIPLFPVEAKATAKAVNKKYKALVEQSINLNMLLSTNYFSKFISKMNLENSKFLIDDELIIIFTINVTFYNDNIRNNHIIQQKKTVKTYENKFVKKRKLNESSNQDSDDNNIDICKTIYKDLLFTDIILNVDGKEIKAHKCVLAAASSIWKRILLNGNKKNSLKSIDIPDFSYELINVAVKFIYTNSVENLANTAFELFEVAFRYNIVKLKDTCEKYLSSVINIGNATNILIVAETYNAMTLKDLAIKFIVKNIKTFKAREDFHEFMDLYPEMLKQIFLSMVP